MKCPECGADTELLIGSFHACTNDDCLMYGRVPIPTDSTSELEEA